MAGLSHFDAKGDAHMVDVSEKAVTARVAVARGQVSMAAETFRLISEGRAKKGDVLSVARLAGIMGAKKTPDLIPLCHPLAITKVAVELSLDPDLPGEVEMDLGQDFALNPQIKGALKSLDGVQTVEEL